MTRPPSDPWAVLGLDSTADTAEVKRAFRNLAMQYHPDVSTLPNAAEKFEEVRVAADQILNRSRRISAHASPSGAAADAAAMIYRTEMLTRHPKFAMWFSAACLVGGCLIFAGALYVHQDLYTYNVHKEMEERRRNPTEGQRRIMDLLTEKQAEKLGDGPR